MAEVNSTCPDCSFDRLEAIPRRDFLRTVGVATAAVSLGGVARAADAPAVKKTEKPAEVLVKELFSGLSDEQKKSVMMPWNHGVNAAGKGIPTRLRMFNGPIAKKISEVYTPAQTELVERILKSLSSGDEGFRMISRGGTWDASKTFNACGAYIFGEPTEGKPYAWVFTGHHLTVRCDGNTTEGPAFGGPIYYGHTPNGYQDKNVFFPQTKAVMSVFDALSTEQQKKATVSGTPGEHEASIEFRKMGDPIPGIAIGDLTKDQRALVEQVMRAVLAPYRKEDTDEVMEIIKATGGMEKIHLAFYREEGADASAKWHFWRLEGPGFVWNFRVLPHVHTYVSISTKQII